VPTSLLQILNDCLLGLLLLFFLRTLRAVWVQVKTPEFVPLAPQPAPAPAPARAAVRGVRIRIVEPAADRGQVFDISDEVTIGRSAGCGVALRDTTVSQIHARLFPRDGKVWVEDLGSTNGTWVNRTKVSAPIALKKGDRIALGKTVLEVGK
jgi:pSer/pThr/pTyr-binding forkhead associated (FHA) protein